MPHPALVAQHAAPDLAPSTRVEAARDLTALLTALSILLALFIILAALLMLRRRALHSARHAAPARQSRRSAWAEAGRRATPPDPGDDDTIDYDPRDLSPDDINPGGTRN